MFLVSVYTVFDCNTCKRPWKESGPETRNERPNRCSIWDADENGGGSTSGDHVTNMSGHAISPLIFCQFAMEWAIYSWFSHQKKRINKNPLWTFKKPKGQIIVLATKKRWRTLLCASNRKRGRCPSLQTAQPGDENSFLDPKIDGI